MTTRDLAATAADHWFALAAKEKDMAAWYEARGLPYGDVSSYYHRAATYIRTGTALRREAMTGKAHCSSCGGAHANHEHPSLPADCGCKCRDDGCPWCKVGAM